MKKFLISLVNNRLFFFNPCNLNKSIIEPSFSQDEKTYEAVTTTPWWLTLNKRKYPQHPDIEVQSNEDGWVRVVLFPNKPISLSNTSPVKLSFEDEDCQFWKGGIDLDYWEVATLIN